MLKRAIPVLVIILLIVAIGWVTLSKMREEKQEAYNEQANYQELYGVSDTTALIYLNNIPEPVKALVNNGSFYLSMDYLRNSFTTRIYWDEAGQTMLYAQPSELWVIAPGDTVAGELDGETIEYKAPIVEIFKSKPYVLLDFIEDYTKVNTESYKDPGRVYLYTDWEKEYQKANILEETPVRVVGDPESPILTTAKKGSRVMVLNELKNYTQIKSSDGFIGYVLNEAVGELSSERMTCTYQEQKFSSITYRDPICLVWHNVEESSGLEYLDELISTTKGVNIIAPTWFVLSDERGNYTSWADADYVTRAHELGLKVWIMLENIRSDENLDILNVLDNRETRERLINNAVRNTKRLGADGINIDFEGLGEEEGYHFIEFIRELSIACHAEKLALSVDNHACVASNNYDANYYLSEQDLFVDYVILMSYDEHYAGSMQGSTSSSGFVEESVMHAVQQVRKSKVVNAIPFYTRIWQETPERLSPWGSTILDHGSNRFERYSLSSTHASMKEAKQFIEENEIELYWSGESQQYYGDVLIDGSLYRIWLEEADSINAKLRIMSQYDIAGVACWRLGQETSDVWDGIQNYLYTAAGIEIVNETSQEEENSY